MLPAPAPVAAMNPAYEPLLTVGGIVALIGAVLALLTAFGIQLTDQQQKAILGISTVVAPLLVAIIARGQVVPTKRVDELVTEAAITGREGG